ncbi:MAG: NADH-quinone oxidoreductase subunit N [Bacillaceae bacterium]
MNMVWFTMTPQIILVIGALFILLLGLFTKSKVRMVAVATVVISLIVLIALYGHEPVQILYGTFKFDSFAKAFSTLFLVAGALVLLLGKEERPEYYMIFLSALTGALFVTASVDLITLFVGIELLSVSSYLLVGLRRENKLANEAAMKYAINGAIATAIMLFGFSYLYGLTGTTNLMEMQLVFQDGITKGTELLFLLAFLISFVGLSFKIASVPFHMWAPDVYEGASTPITAFLSVVSKATGFVLLVRIIFYLFSGVPNAKGTELLYFSVDTFIAVLAGLSMIIGNVMALRQKSIKRMLAYSSIAHAGYILVALVSFSAFFFDSLWFYLMAYLFMTIGAFAVVSKLEGEKDDITMFGGLFKRSPFLAIAMTIFLLSLAGIPGTVGFIGKVTIFLGAFAVNPAHYVLAFLMIGMSVVSLVYYFGIMAQMFLRPKSETAIHSSIGATVVIVICSLAVIGFGLFPNVAMDFFHSQWPIVQDFMK